jgi:CRISPR system Cascade subunit CasE
VNDPSPLHMVSFTPDRTSLIALAQARGKLLPDGDLGYAIHQVLTGLFGAAAPKPFQLMDNGRFQLLGYSAADEAALTDYADLQKTRVPDWEVMASTLNFLKMRVRAMPSVWSEGRKYRFSVRTRPVVRINRAKERGLPRECDVFLRTIEREQNGSDRISRQEVYLSWFRKQISETAAQLGTLSIGAMTRTRVSRKGATAISGPDVTFTGILAVADPVQFASLLARGVGRHRAFGFGMLLLSPAH